MQVIGKPVATVLWATKKPIHAMVMPPNGLIETPMLMDIVGIKQNLISLKMPNKSVLDTKRTRNQNWNR